MRTLTIERSLLLVIDIQSRLMPAIHDGDRVVKNARRLVDAASLLGVPRLTTEQNPKGLGGTVAALAPGDGEAVFTKATFDAWPCAGLREAAPAGREIVVAGCEAHVCVLQTVLGLLGRGRRVVVVADAVGSRRPESREQALRRLDRHGAEIVTAEMAIFEWLGTAEHPRFREALALVR